MGMFDYYRPLGKFECPVCHVLLREWQSKDGPCKLYVWDEGVEAPVGQSGDDDWKKPEMMKLARLPVAFDIIPCDCNCNSIYCKCKTVDGVWRETVVKEVAPQSQHDV